MMMMQQIQQGKLNSLARWAGAKAEAAASGTERTAVLAGGNGDVDMRRFLSPGLKNMTLVQEGSFAGPVVGALAYQQPYQFGTRYGRYYEDGTPLLLKSGSGASGVFGQRVITTSPEPYQSPGKDANGKPDPRWPAGGIIRIDDGTGGYYVHTTFAIGVPVRAQPSGLYLPQGEGGYIQVRRKRWYRAPFSGAGAATNPYYTYDVTLEWRVGGDYITRAGERYDDDYNQPGSLDGTPVLYWVFRAAGAGGTAGTGVVRQNPVLDATHTDPWVGLANYVP